MDLHVPLIVLVWVIVIAGWLICLIRIGPPGDYDFGTPFAHAINFCGWLIVGLVATCIWLALR